MAAVEAETPSPKHKKDSKKDSSAEPPLDAYALEIHYKDPIHGLPCKENIFLDRNDPTFKSKALRLLVSVESVNMLRQSQKSSENKLQMVRSDLNASRMAFHQELQHLRQKLIDLAAAAPDLSEKVAAVMNTETSAPDQAKEKKSPQAGYQVYFFRVEEYLDDRATDMMNKVIEKVRKELEQEIENLKEQVAALGGKGNKQILVLLLQSGASAPKITEDLVKLMCSGDEERRVMENALTGGLRDRLDFLINREESLQSELERRKEELVELDNLKFNQHRNIEELRMKVKDARDEVSNLKELNDQATKQKEQLDFHVEQLKEKVEKQQAAERRALQQEREQIEEEHKEQDKMIEQAQKAANDAHNEVCGRLAEEESIPMPVEEDNTEKFAELEHAKKRVEEATLMQESWSKRLEHAEAEKAKSTQHLEDLKLKIEPLKEKLTEAPPIDPRQIEYEKIQEQIKSVKENKEVLLKEIENSNKQKKGLEKKVKAKKQVLGQKDDSGSDDERPAQRSSKQEEIAADPMLDDYKNRRLMATFGGKKKISIGTFLHDDGESRRRRSMKQIDKFKKAAMVNMLRVLNANAGVKVEDDEILAECEKMFGRDPASKSHPRDKAVEAAAAQKAAGDAKARLAEAEAYAASQGSSAAMDAEIARLKNEYEMAKKAAKGAAKEAASEGSKRSPVRTCREGPLLSLQQPETLHMTWPDGFGRLVPKESSMDEVTTAEQQAEVFERRLVASERRAAEAQRRVDSSAWTTCRLQDLMQDLGSKLQTALSEERALREELPRAVISFLGTLPAEFSKGEIESLLSQYQATMEELRDFEDDIGEAAALIEGQDAEAHKEGSPNANLAACRVLFEEHAVALRESISQAVYSVKDLGLMTELMTWTAKVDNVIMGLVKHQDARADLASQVLQVSQAMQKEQELQEELMVTIQTEEARQRSIAMDMEQIDISQVRIERSSLASSPRQDTLMDQNSETLMAPAPDSRTSSPGLVGESPEALPALYGRGSGDSEFVGMPLSDEGLRRRKTNVRKLRPVTQDSTGKSHTTDFGFRQDGEGEESLENWALFKVTKNPDKKDRRGGTGGLRRRQMPAFPRELRICNSEPKLRQGTADFREYITKGGFSKPDFLDEHARSHVWGTKRHRHSLPVIAQVVGLMTH